MSVMVPRKRSRLGGARLSVPSAVTNDRNAQIPLKLSDCPRSLACWSEFLRAEMVTTSGVSSASPAAILLGGSRTISIS